ncbi:2-methylcitrate dehydratase [Streptomyces sulfonofaciens]|uniref:2-methylcitrate dehydratase n=1 Tax=Streptomyces sulfonofaciens TaxID=68272 RepID=A0A919GJN8_9ACTN|nr:MmgE/PrpD family protein [Streptomyces sulfonofaciens]GHH86045.1 2-methylcitrate dehydratase [Streptomyces sulfonofaciens]
MSDFTGPAVPEQAARTVAERIAERVTAVRFDDLPAEVVERTKLVILDQLGVQLLGARLPNVRPVLRLAERQGGTPEATLTHSGARTTASRAAWANGALGHSCEYDDAHALGWHTASAVVPAALALAERDGASGRRLITAVAAGIQVMALLGAATTGMITTGWHGSKVLGVFGAAAAAGVLLGLDTAELVNAFGIAASDAGGTMEYDRSGGEVKRLHSGSAARSGLEAAELARYGLTGPSTVFEGSRGVFRLFGGSDAGIPEAAWQRWHVLDTIFRFYPAVGTVHAPLDAVRHLREEHGVRAADIRRIRVGLVDFAVGHGASITRPTDAISAQFSLAFGIGLQFATGGNAPADYLDPARWTDPGILSVGDLVEPYAMAIPEGDPAFSAAVDIDLHDGTSLGRYQAGFRGHPRVPATATEIEDKFRANARGTVPAARAHALARAVEALDTVDEVRTVTRLLAPDGQ